MMNKYGETKVRNTFISFKAIYAFFLFITSFFVIISCNSRELEVETTRKNQFELTSKPYTRYWWFADILKKEDIRFNLNWLKEKGFGGVELAFVYPLNRNSKTDTLYKPRQEWLSPEWQEIVKFAILYADSIGLGCDITFGTLWPFGDSKVSFDQATQKYGDKDWRQEIIASWEYPRKGYVIDHLNPKHYTPYFERLMSCYPRPKTKIPQAYFIDSWEVETERLWTDGFAGDFKRRFHYDISPYMDSIYSPKNSKYLYDYMSLISEKVIRFYEDFDHYLNKNGVFSRGQVSGAPCDLISAYSRLDIPESESMLFEPEFCSIAASAASLSGKNIITAETFTCLYGWPRDNIRQEQTADLKLVADALFANGLNHVIWHGKAHNPINSDSINFYATTHLGDSGTLAKELPQFNKYLEKISSYMKKGHNYFDIGVYLPTEDAWRKGVMPKEKQFKWAWGYYEMRYIYFPEELCGYNPVWINSEFLQKGTVENGVFSVGDVSFDLLYLDVKYLDFKVLKRLNELAAMGLKIVIKNSPESPGAKEHKDYQTLVKKLFASKFVVKDVHRSKQSFLDGETIPNHWCRIDKNNLYLFFANPKSSRIKFPLEYGQSFCEKTVTIPITINYLGKTISTILEFKPYQSLLYKLEDGNLKKIDISFVPKTPVQRERPKNYVAPWLVKE